MITDEQIRSYKKRFDALKSDPERAHYEDHCDDIARVISPRKQGFSGEMTKGAKRNHHVFDPTGVHSLELLAAGLHGMATNPAAKWFSLRLVDDQDNEDPAVMSYLADVEDRMWSEIYSPGTNFTTALHEAYHDLGAFGTACLFVGQRDDNKILFQARNLTEILIAENADGVVDTVYRCTEYTVAQLWELWQRGEWNRPSDAVMEKWENEKYNERVKVIHLVMPRRMRDVERKDKGNMPFLSCYFEHADSHLLKEGGVEEFPYLVPRWAKLAGEVYGRSPAMTALPDVKMLQQMSLTLIKAAQKATDPAIFLPSDGTFGKQIRIVPGGVNYYKGRGQDIVPMPTPDKLPITLEIMEAVRNRIRTTFYVDVLQIVQDREMTATEVMQRTQERMRLMGPMVGRLEAELLGPLVTRVFGILSREGKLPEPPPQLEGREFTVEYVSPIATAQKQTEAEGFIHVVQLAGAFGEQGLMELGKRMNFDRAIHYWWDLFNVNPDLINNEDEQAAATQQEQQMMAAEQAPKVAQAAASSAKAAKDAGQAQNEGGVDLAQLFGQGAQAPGPEDAAMMGDDGPLDIEAIMGAA